MSRNEHGLDDGPLAPSHNTATPPLRARNRRVLVPLLFLLVASLRGPSSGTEPTGALASGDRSAREAQLRSALALRPPVPKRESSSVLPDIQGFIARREYTASLNGSGLQAPNRRHGLRTYFGADGIRVHDRTGVGSPILLSLSLVGAGRGTELAAVAPGRVDRTEARVEIRHPGAVEWFDNSPRGLEHGIDLAKALPGVGPLRLEFEVDHAAPSLSRDRVEFETEAGRRLAYDGLVARDATGALLPAWFERSRSNRIRIVVSDAGATYPLEIDPLLSDPAAAIVESDQVDAILGVSVSDAGDVNADGYGDVIVGARYFDSGNDLAGAAFVFMGSATGLTQLHAGSVTQLGSLQFGSYLGESVSSAGDVNGDGYDDVIVGAFFYSALNFSSGAAFIFHGGPTGIPNGTTETADTQLVMDQIMAYCGNSVSSAGDVDGDGYADVIVGCAQYDVGQADEGVAWIFMGGPGGIPDSTPATAAAQLESNQANAFFGSSVSNAGDVNGDGFGDVIVGAPGYQTGTTDGGSAFVFLGSPDGITDGDPSTAATHLSSTFTIDGFGTSVSGAGDVNGDGHADVIVGHPRYNVDQGLEGAAFVFLGGSAGVPNATTATAHARMKSSQPDSEFGVSVSGAGDLNGDGYGDVVVGARSYNQNAFDDGGAFVFLGSAAGIATGDPAEAAARLTSGQTDARFGWSVSGAGDVNGDGYADLLVGAPTFDAGQRDEGAAFLFHGSSLGIGDGDASTARARIEANQGNAGLGSSLAEAGDVNGDGYPDLIVGADGFDAGQSNEGAAFVFTGGPSGIPSGNPASAPSQLEGNQGSAHFGRSVGGAGDVNGDGYSDVIVGAPDYDAGETNEGAAFVFLGSATGIADGNPSTSAAQLESNQANASFGSSVAGAADVDGDGLADVIVGAERYDSGETDEGAAFVFPGGSAGVADGNPATAAARLQSNQAGAAFGESVAGVGDVDGDGDGDVIVGAGSYDAGQIDEGGAFVFTGRPGGVGDGNPATASTRLEANQAGAGLGRRVAAAGDVNGDGFADLLVGAPTYDTSVVDAGAAFVFHGGPGGVGSGSPSSSATRLESDQTGSLFGGAVASAGDVDGDGHADVVVGASAYDAGENDEGAAFLFRGSSSGIAHGGPSTAAAQLESDQAGAALGVGVTGADVDADGDTDLIVGAPLFDAGQGNEGAALLFLSNGHGRDVLARQRRGNASGIPVQSWGSSYADSFEVQLRATDPAGRGRVKLEIEACPNGLRFGSAGCPRVRSSSWVDVSALASGVDLTNSVVNVSAGALSRWRARILYAPLGVDRPGIVAPLRPRHGPWRRLSAHAIEGDVRPLPEPSAGLGVAIGVVGLLVLLDGSRRGRSLRAHRPIARPLTPPFATSLAKAIAPTATPSPSASPGSGTAQTLPTKSPFESSCERLHFPPGPHSPFERHGAPSRPIRQVPYSGPFALAGQLSQLSRMPS